MVEIDKNKIQFKYLTGINKTLEGYPTPLDILYDSCVETVDGTFYSEAKIENKYKVSEERVKEIIDELVDKKYIEKKVKNYKIINTPWSC